jgi:hypothetical protein
VRRRVGGRRGDAAMVEVEHHAKKMEVMSL